MDDIADLIQADLAAKEELRQRNRREMPGTAALVDELSAVFGEVKVRWAKEGDKEIGKRQVVSFLRSKSDATCQSIPTCESTGDDDTYAPSPTS